MYRLYILYLGPSPQEFKHHPFVPIFADTRYSMWFISTTKMEPSWSRHKKTPQISNKYKLSLGRKRVFHPRSMCNVTSHKTSISHLQKKASNLWNVPQMFVSNTFWRRGTSSALSNLFKRLAALLFLLLLNGKRSGGILVVFFRNAAVWTFHQDHLVCSKKQDVTQGARSDFLFFFVNKNPLKVTASWIIGRWDV